NVFFICVLLPPPSSTLFPYTTLFRSTFSLPCTISLPPSFASTLATRAKRLASLPVAGSRSTKHFWLARIVSRVASSGILRKSSRSEEHTSELQSRENLVCRLLLEKKK